MNKWIKNAWIAVMVLFAALISTGCGSKEEAYREIRVLSLEGTSSVTRASVGTMDAYKDMRLNLVTRLLLTVAAIWYWSWMEISM